MNKNLAPLVIGLAVAATGCTLTPKYNRPAAPVPAEWPGGPAYTNRPSGANTPRGADLDWRDFFIDAKLQKAIGIALTNNRDLRLAALNVEKARAMYGIQRGELYPTVDAQGTGSKARTPASLSSNGKHTTFERYDANFGDAAWELDLFGRIRSLKEEALQTYFATEQARRGAHILLVASVANACLAFAADSENLSLAQTTLAAGISH